MFGRLCLLVDEKLTVAAGSGGDLMIRCAPGRVEAPLRDGARWAEMNGRPMSRGRLV